MDELYEHEVIIPKKGDLLISEPFLPDPNFERTVILLCEHNDEGSFGFVLNKLSMLKFSDVIQEVGEFQKPLYVGGPVQQDTLHFVHRVGNTLEGSVPVNDELYWGGNFEQVKVMINSDSIKEYDYKFFIGYSGWGEGQLMDEINAKSWIVCPSANANQVFDTDPSNLWREILKSMGGKYKVFSNYPTDPRLN